MRKTLSPIIALITDFGAKDWYVGSIKGQILRQFPEANLVDITHQIPPGSIWHASYVLSSCMKDFPSDTLFMVVVDPGVGTHRECILGRIGDYTVLCPNNGILSHSLHYNPNQNGPFYEILPENALSAPMISSTFHGRDIFAPIAGRIASGSLKPEGLGPIVHNLVRLQIPKTEFKRGVIYGSVQYFDHFGNAITDISQSELELFSIKPTAYVEIKDTTIAMKSTFAEVEVGQPLTYIGSNGFLEIAINRRNAAKQLNLKIGDAISLHLELIAESPTSLKDILPPEA